MSGFSAIDLPSLPAPDIVETIDFETILAVLVAEYQTLNPDWDATIESDPVLKLLQVCTTREVHLRQRTNDATKGVMLAYAKGSDLDHLGALFGVQRQIVTPADLEASPPVEAVMESDDRLRQRIQLALESYTTAGSVGAYTFHAMSADASVKDVHVSSPTAGTVEISVLSVEGDGTPSGDLLNSVTLATTAEDVRPLCDKVLITAPSIISYDITAELTFYDGPDQEVVRAAAQAAAEQYAADHHRLGHDITLSGLFHALHQTGVQNVTLTSPAADIPVDGNEAAWLNNITVTAGGTDE